MFTFAGCLINADSNKMCEFMRHAELANGSAKFLSRYVQTNPFKTFAFYQSKKLGSFTSELNFLYVCNAAYFFILQTKVN